MEFRENTPNEAFDGIEIDFSSYSEHFKQQKSIRIVQNQQNYCKTC